MKCGQLREWNCANVLQVFDVPSLSSEDLDALHGSMVDLVVARPSLAAQVVAACADPDPRIAFAALVCIKRQLGDRNVSSVMMKAGAVPAVMSALEQANPCCRAAAASVVAGGILKSDVRGPCVRALFACPEAVEALLEAGLVPALMHIICSGPSDHVPPAGPGVFSNPTMEISPAKQLITLPNSEPALHACLALSLLAECEATLFSDVGWGRSKSTHVAVEVAKTPRAAAMLVQCLRHYTGDLQVAPGQLICSVLTTLNKHGGSSHAACRHAFCKALLEAGLADLAASLIRPGKPGITEIVMSIVPETFKALGPDCIPPQCLWAIVDACARFIEEDGGDSKWDSIRGKAAIFLLDVIGALFPRRSCKQLFAAV